MGHAGAWAGVGEPTAEEKYKILQDAGVTMVDHPEKFGNVMKGLLKQAGKDVSKIQQSAAANQRRGMHTMRQLRPRITSQASKFGTSQQRNLHLRNQKAVDHLSKSLEGFNISEETPNNADSVYLSISVDRSSRSPCIIASPSANPRKLHHRLRRFPFSYVEGPDQETILAAIQHLQLDAAPPAAHAQTAKLISKLADLYREQEAVSLAVNLSISTSGTLNLSQPQLFYDDAAFKSNKRHPEIHGLRDISAEPAVEVEAEKSGIVFVKLHPDDDAANIGTLVNGAGLAMNTVDALALPPHNGKCANFLDTGGKATSETVKTSFELILRDPRVKVIFVNIFGGLTDCGMIADGVIMAFEQVDMQGKPVVVRLRGTNEEVGQKKIAESGLPLEAFDGFHEAAQRVVELAGKS
ncbi:succinyl-CoA synthetase-like protein, partial [Aureobasidium melanogenum]